MSRDASPPGGNPDTVAPVSSNTKAARASLSPPMIDVSLKAMAEVRGVSINESSSEDEDDQPTNEATPLITSPTSVTSDTSSTGVRNRRILGLPDAVRCDCHEPPKPADKASRNRLMIACVVVLVFMIGEVVGSLCVTLSTRKL